MRTLAILLSSATVVGACGGGAANRSPVGNQASTEPPATGTVGAPIMDVASFTALLQAGTYDAVIGPAVGVVELRLVASGDDAVPTEMWTRRQCGAAASAAARAAGQAILARVGTSADYAITCGDWGDGFACGQNGLAEYDLSYSFRFARTDGRFVLVGLETVDVGSTSEQLEDQYAALRADASDRCP